MIMLADRNNPNFAESLRESRGKLHLTQLQAAERAGISHVMISRYERGDSVPSQLTWSRLSKALQAETPLDTSRAPAAESDALKNYSSDQLVAELKRRGATSVTVAW